MKKIQKFEDAITTGASLKALGINATMFEAYRNSLEAGSNLLNFSEVIWDEDVDAITEACRENGITAFTISSTFSSLIATLAAFEKCGVQMDGLTTVKTRYTDWRTGEQASAPAIRMTVK